MSQLKGWCVGIAFLSAVQLSDFREMNLSDPDLLIAVLLLLLFLGNDLPVSEVAFHEYMRALLKGFLKRREVAPGDEAVPFRTSDVPVAILVLPGRRRGYG